MRLFMVRHRPTTNDKEILHGHGVHRISEDRHATGLHDPALVVGYRPLDPLAYDRTFHKGVLAGDRYRQVFEDCAQRHNLNAGFLAGITAFETGGGTSSMIRNKNNTGGLTAHGKYSKFNSVEESIEVKAAMLARHYVQHGKTTLASIAKEYAPVGAKNDPNKTNGQWPSSVATFAVRLTGPSIATEAARVRPVMTPRRTLKP